MRRSKYKDIFSLFVFPFELCHSGIENVDLPDSPINWGPPHSVKTQRNALRAIFDLSLPYLMNILCFRPLIVTTEKHGARQTGVSLGYAISDLKILSPPFSFFIFAAAYQKG